MKECDGHRRWFRSLTHLQPAWTDRVALPRRQDAESTVVWMPRERKWIWQTSDKTTTASMSSSSGKQFLLYHNLGPSFALVYSSRICKNTVSNDIADSILSRTIAVIHNWRCFVSSFAGIKQCLETFFMTLSRRKQTLSLGTSMEVAHEIE